MQNHPPEAYVHLSADETTLTFYFDTLRATREGKIWEIDQTQKDCYIIFIPAWAGTAETPNTTIQTAVFDASFFYFCPNTTAGWFQHLKSLKSIKGMEYLNTSQVTNMSHMYFGCKDLTILNLSHFDTSKVTNMCSMFACCYALTELDLSSFNTKQVIDMGAMFSNCSFIIKLNLSAFNTSKVETMGHMFSACSSLPTLDLSSFDTSKVTYMSWMFRGCSSLTTIYSNSTWSCKMSDSMFAGCTSLRGAVPYDESKTDASMANPETGYFTSRR